MPSPKKFHADSDFVSIGKKLADQTHELEATIMEGEACKIRLAETRQNLDISRGELKAIKMHQTLTAAEADAFEARFEKVEKDVVIKGHDEINLRREVQDLMQELYLVKLEHSELLTELEHEEYAREHFNELIERAQGELAEQIRDRDLLRRGAYEAGKVAATQRERVRSFTTANGAILRDLA